MTTAAHAGAPQIFVSIASYRDEYLPFTIDSAIAHAVHPDRLVFGICWQSDDRENLDRFIADPRFRIRKYPYSASLGYGWARAEVQKLYGGEKYHLLIDSHTAFAPSWDQNLIVQLEGKPGEKPLLTTSSPPFTFDKSGNVVFPWADTDMDGVPLIKCDVIRPAGWLDIQMSRARKSAPDQHTPFVCCNFVFTHGAWIVEVPEDPAMINAGHEGPLSLRTYTHGYDIYLPDAIQVWHLDYANYPDGHRRKVWETKSNRWQAERTDRMIRRLHTLVYGKGDPFSLGRYGPGKERSVGDWAAAAGLDLTL
jgi:UDP-N-acetylglucosamine (GlcNAc):hydroxyproline polypeptide GlcNAc-transferase